MTKPLHAATRRWLERTPTAAPASQRGIVIFIALIVLVAMTLAGLAMVRSSGTSILTAGNLAFRQNATTSADAGIEAAFAWVRSQGISVLEANGPTSTGYYATWDIAGTPSSFNQDPMRWGGWDATGGWGTGGTDAAGNRVRYVIHRMCKQTGAVDTYNATTGQECVTRPQNVGSTKGGAQYGEKALTGVSATPYFRVTVRIDGPKNTVSVVQAMFY